MEQKLFDLLKEALEIEDRDLSPEDNFRDYPEWDSLGQLSVIAALDEQFGVVIEGSEFSKISSIGDLLVKIKSLS
jgi:acyl carrier protein